MSNDITNNNNHPPGVVDAPQEHNVVSYLVIGEQADNTVAIHPLPHNNNNYSGLESATIRTIRQDNIEADPEVVLVGSNAQLDPRVSSEQAAAHASSIQAQEASRQALERVVGGVERASALVPEVAASLQASQQAHSSSSASSDSTVHSDTGSAYCCQVELVVDHRGRGRNILYLVKLRNVANAVWVSKRSQFVCPCAIAEYRRRIERMRNLDRRSRLRLHLYSAAEYAAPAHRDYGSMMNVRNNSNPQQHPQQPVHNSNRQLVSNSSLDNNNHVYMPRYPTTTGNSQQQLNLHHHHHQQHCTGQAQASIQPQQLSAAASSSASTLNQAPQNGLDLATDTDFVVGVCKVCLTERVNVALIACGHCVVCVGCVLRLVATETRSCPICRQKIISYMRIYFS